MSRTWLGLILGLLLACAGSGPSPDAPIVRVTIPPGATLQAVADSLAARGVVRDARRFSVVARLKGLERGLQAGIYDLRVGERIDTVLAVLAEGRTASLRFTVPEGLTVSDLAALAESELRMPADSVIAAARKLSQEGAITGAGPVLEGYLFPDTYALPVGVTADQLVDRMVEGFGATWLPSWTDRLDTLRLTRHQLVTLASIVEGEARLDGERRTIAGVYHNRLRRRMPLQADPTVQYAIELATGERPGRLYLKDYRFPSAYNTYLHPGLPPGPVSSPGRASIEAALYPADVPYLFFVARGDGSHEFNTTYRDHVNAINRIRGPQD
ncbi:MAG: endolytic transglycosylase MltG [Gemmatimonadales bacterium]